MEAASLTLISGALGGGDSVEGVHVGGLKMMRMRRSRGLPVPGECAALRAMIEGGQTHCGSGFCGFFLYPKMSTRPACRSSPDAKVGRKNLHRGETSTLPPAVCACRGSEAPRFPVEAPDGQILSRTVAVFAAARNSPLRGEGPVPSGRAGAEPVVRRSFPLSVPHRCSSYVISIRPRCARCLAAPWNRTLWVGAS